MIRFDELQETKIPNFYGGQGEVSATMISDNLNRIMKGRLGKGVSIGLHRHDTSSEIVFIIGGSAKAICDGVEENLRAGDCHYCKKGSEHTIINDGDDDLIFYAVVPQQ